MGWFRTVCKCGVFMKKNHYGQMILVLGLCSMVYADVDIVALKKNVEADVALSVKRATEDSQKVIDDFRLRDVQAELLLKTYPKDEHESFRAAEEKRLVERINEKSQKLSRDVAALVEKAFVDIMKQQKEFEDACKKDAAAFKQQFSENITKILQGKKATPISYSASEGVAKGSSDAPFKPLSSKIEDLPMPDGIKNDMALEDKKPPFEPMASKKKNLKMNDVENVAMGSAQPPAASFSMGTPVGGAPKAAASFEPAQKMDAPSADVELPVSKKPDAKKISAEPVKSSTKGSKLSKDQIDLLKQIRG